MTNYTKSYEVERILGRRFKNNNNIEYLVKWVGYKNPDWEPENHLDNCDEKIIEFMKNMRLRKQPPNK